MATGKTTVGKLISEKLNKEFIDTDKLIEKSTGMKISDIFEKFGEKYFRYLESNIVKEVYNKKDLVIATGGGIVLNSENIKLLKRRGILFLLEGSVDSIVRNLNNSKIERPLVKEKNIKERVLYLLRKRKDFYAKSKDFVINIDNKTPNKVAEEIINIFNNLAKVNDK
jgi:shikimate kinase